jgi:hypothetical protein
MTFIASMGLPMILAAVPVRTVPDVYRMSYRVYRFGDCRLCVWIFLLVILGAIFLWRVGAEDKLMEPTIS